MAQLPTYTTLEEKEKVFEPFLLPTIETVKEFNDWYNSVSGRQKSESIRIPSILSQMNEDNVYDQYPYIFRGSGEAKHKIFSSGQRDWIVNNIGEWQSKKSYLEYINELVQKASDTPLLRKVFKFYNLHHNQTNFPTLSILQHYGAPTPLVDFTYSLDVALYFATEFCVHKDGANKIEQYFSITAIDRRFQESEFLNITRFHQGTYPKISSFYDFQKDNNSVFYVSDFESYPGKKSQGFQDQRPLTILFNQRIIPQEGLFVFNPSPKTSLEERFSFNGRDNLNLELKKMLCVNINKDLSEYIRRKIKLSNIDKLYIYPELDSHSSFVRSEVLNALLS